MKIFLSRCLAALFGTILFACTVSTAHATNEWITVNKDYSSQRYVDLDQINRENVHQLKEVCEAHLNEPSWFSSGILMVDRSLYVTTLRATYAIDAATCAVRWRSVIKLGQPANVSNRGPGYLDGMIFAEPSTVESSRSTPKRGRCYGIGRKPIPSRTNHSLRRPSRGMARCFSASRSAISESAAESSALTRRPAGNCGGLHRS